MSLSPLSVAPMLNLTDRHFLYLARLISPHVSLYTEMITTGAMLHRGCQPCPTTGSVVVQLGGGETEALAQCARMATDAGYTEINLNVGCPSSRVQAGSFGVCLMREPKRVAACVDAMKRATHLPVTVKTRIGVDHDDSYEFLHRLVGALVDVQVDALIVHARKAWLKGLNPKQNRHIPPLKYEVVYRLKHDFPQLPIIINGGVVDLTSINQLLQRVDGVMVGRAAYRDLWLLAQWQQQHSPADETPSRQQVLTQYMSYAHDAHSRGAPIHRLIKPLQGLFYQVPHAKAWRQGFQDATHFFQRGWQAWLASDHHSA